MAMKFRRIKGASGKDHMTSHWSREVPKIIESYLPLKGDMWSLPAGYLYPVAIIQCCWPHEKIRPAVRLHPLKCWTRQFSMNNVAMNSSTVTRFSLLASYNIKVDTPFSLHLSVLFCFLPSSQYQRNLEDQPPPYTSSNGSGVISMSSQSFQPQRRSQERPKQRHHMTKTMV